jgi:hypothetical protein
MPDVRVDVRAEVSGAEKTIKAFSRSLEGCGRVVSAAFGARGGGLAVTSMSKGLVDLSRRAGEAKRGVEELSRVLSRLQQERGRLQGMAGAVNPSDVRELQARERIVQRDLLRARRRSAILDERLGVRGEMEPGEPGGGGGGRPSFNSGDLRRLATPGGIAGMAEQVAGGLLAEGGVLGGAVAAVAALVTGGAITSFKKASAEQQMLADFLPRVMNAGGLAGLGGSSQGMRDIAANLRNTGKQFGFGSAETLGIMGAIAPAGGRPGGGLERDATAAMQMARMFGIDAGQQAGMLGEAGKMGAFKPGDARKFASMLAQEIATTGLGPRATEVQEATLMLANRAMATMPDAGNTAGMALQTLFNRSGVEAFTGMRGAGVLSNIQSAIANPTGDAEGALDQAVFRKMGIRDFFGQEEEREKGILGDPKLLPTYIQFLRQNGKSERETRFLLKKRFGIPMLQSKALFAGLGGMENVTTGRVNEVQRFLKNGGRTLDQGAAAAMGLPGNIFRRGAADVEAIALRAGTPMAQKLAEAVKATTDVADKAEKIWDTSKEIRENTGTLAALALKGAIANPGNPLAGAAGGLGLGLGEKAGIALGQKAKSLYDRYILGIPAAGAAGGGADLQPGDTTATAKIKVKSLAQKYGLKVSSEDRPGAITSYGHPSLHSVHRAIDFSGGTVEQKMAFFEAVHKQFPGLAELFFSPSGFYKAGHRFAAKAELYRQHTGHVHVGFGDPHVTAADKAVTVNFYDHSAATSHALDQTIHRAINAAKLHNARSHPNRKNPR